VISGAEDWPPLTVVPLLLMLLLLLYA